MFKYGSALPISVIVAVVVLALVGGSNLYANQQVEKAIQEEVEKSNISQSLNSLKTVDQIRTIAEASLSGATIISISLENEDAGYVYKVKLSDGRVLFYNATTGEAILDPSSDEAENENEEDIPAGFVASISLEQARSIASGRRPGQVIRKIELEVEDGVVVYSVKFVDGGRVEINATTGQVTRVENGDDDASDDNDEDSDSDESDSEDDDSDDSDDDNDGDSSGSDDSDDDSQDNSGSGSGSN
ncbi:PepSY domain-containing protein [Candidatus Berkelbacteria bacterium]|nr:PepSY domain-containing protein [Candidatus Berkelbacteria bacterium]